MLCRYIAIVLLVMVAGCEQQNIEVVQSDARFISVEQRVQSGKANNIHSLIAWQDNEKVFELHRQSGGTYGTHKTSSVPVGAHELHNVHSVTKSFVATLIFIAIDEGKLANLDVPVFSLFPEYQQSDREAKMTITVRDVMNMSTGYALDELATSYSQGSGNVFSRHYMAEDLQTMFLETKLAFEPGSRFAYSGLSTVGLSKIIERIYNKPFTQVMREKIFEPLEIDNYRWLAQHGSNEPGADWGLMLSPLDMGKFGLMWVNRGEYQGQRIVAKHWFDMLRSSSFYSYSMGYRLHFWQIAKISGAVAANGIGEQYIVMLPNQNAVIVATGGNYDIPSMPSLDTVRLLASLL
ncbi:serine hydrolase domain-containing protein [Vibrio fluminensis]|uniref:serine hydrolase domain-containing protein n=1 Tax=Vibrio fluminensis TaxID=2783614 RepID=UPI00188961BD|nr:serine hydrolase [Vibrio fluminensis]